MVCTAGRGTSGAGLRRLLHAGVVAREGVRPSTAQVLLCWAVTRREEFKCQWPGGLVATTMAAAA